MEFANVGADIGGGFENTMELKHTKKPLMGQMEKEAWVKEIENEHDQMVKNDAWKPVKKTHS